MTITKHLQHFGFLGTQRLHRWEGDLCDTEGSFAPQQSISRNCLIMTTVIKAEELGYKVWHSAKLQPRPILKYSDRLANLTNLEE